MRAATAPIAATAIANTTGPGRVTARAKGRGANTHGDTSAAPDSAITPARVTSTPGPSNVFSGQTYFAPSTATVCSTSGNASVTTPSCEPRSRPGPKQLATSETTAIANKISSANDSEVGAAITSGIDASSAAPASEMFATQSRTVRDSRSPSTTRTPIRIAASVPAK